MKKRKILAVVMSIIMLLSSAPLGGLVGLDLPDLFKTEASAASYNGLYYEINSGEVTITGYDESSETVVIPSTIDGYPVTSIGNGAFYSCKSLTSVTIPDSVTSIGYRAFADCTRLTSVTIPDSVTSIGWSAFQDCDSLTSIEIPDSVTSIGNGAFEDCTSLTSIAVTVTNENYSSDSNGVLYNKDKTTLIQYPIGNSRTSFIIPDSVTSIGDYAFYWCDSLTSVTIGNSVTSIGGWAFSYCTSLTSIEIPDSVTTIGEFAFYDCKSLTSIEIPDSVTSIGEGAFRDCNSLTSIAVTVTNENYSSDSNGVLYNKDKTTLIQYPIGNSRTSFIIPDSVTSIGEGAFYDCNSLTSVTIGNSVTSIGGWAFSGCTSLISIEIPDSVTSIDMFAIGYYWDEDEDDNLKIKNFTIYGNKNTAAEEYANDNDFKFISLGEAPHTHTFGNWTVTKPATCKEAGAKERTCTECSEKETAVIDKLTTHTYKTTTAKATLTSNGKIETKCSVCGNVSKKTTIYYPKTFTLSATKFTYTGKAIKPTVTVKDSNGKVVSSSNYTVSYSSNINAGTGKVTITFKGNYSGTKTVNFTITPKQVTGLKASTIKTDSIKLTWSKTAGAKYYKVEQSTDGKKWKTVTTTDKTSYTVKKLTAGKKYQFRVTALDSTKKIAGKTSSVLKTGTLTKAPALTLKSTKSKTATASWKKVTGASKYVVYKSTNGKKWKKVTTTTKTSYTLKKLTGGKKVYVKVAALNAYSKASAYSSTKNVKVKK